MMQQDASARAVARLESLLAGHEERAHTLALKSNELELQLAQERDALSRANKLNEASAESAASLHQRLQVRGARAEC